MRRDQRKAIAAAKRGTVLTALLFACAAGAQATGSVNDYQLPPAPSPPPAPVEGPVDTENPVAAPTRPAAQPSPAPAEPDAASSTPDITLPDITAPRRTMRAPPMATQPAAPPGPPASDIFASPSEPAIEPAAPASTSPEAITPPPADGGPTVGWILAFAGLVVVLMLSSLLWTRRKRDSSELAEAPARPEPPAPTLAASAPAVLPPIGEAPARPVPKPASPAAEPAPAPPPPAAAPAPSAANARPLGLSIAPQSLRLSFVYATLAYRLDLTNHGAVPLAELRIAADLTSGHASRPAGQQLSFEGAEPETKHDIAALAPGETISLSGELRVPLADILPLQAGAALFFAPLARFRVAAEGIDDTRIFSIGLPSSRAGDTMQPIRLDLGPQLFRALDHREIEVARWLPLDEARRAS